MNIVKYELQQKNNTLKLPWALEGPKTMLIDIKYEI